SRRCGSASTGARGRTCRAASSESPTASAGGRRRRRTHLFNSTTDGGGPLAAPKTIDTLLSAQQGDGSGAWLTSPGGQVRFPRLPVWGDIAPVGRSDAAYARRFYASQADRGSVIGSPGTDLIWAGGRLVDAWPANPDENESSHVRESNVETLLIRLHPPVALGINFAPSQGIVRLAATVVGT